MDLVKVKRLDKDQLMQKLQQNGFEEIAAILSNKDIKGQELLDLRELDIFKWGLKSVQKKLLFTFIDNLKKDPSILVRRYNNVVCKPRAEPLNFPPTSNPPLRKMEQPPLTKPKIEKRINPDSKFHGEIDFRQKLGSILGGQNEPSVKPLHPEVPSVAQKQNITKPIQDQSKSPRQPPAKLKPRGISQNSSKPSCALETKPRSTAPLGGQNEASVKPLPPLHSEVPSVAQKQNITKPIQDQSKSPRPPPAKLKVRDFSQNSSKPSCAFDIKPRSPARLGDRNDASVKPLPPLHPEVSPVAQKPKITKPLQDQSKSPRPPPAQLKLRGISQNSFKLSSALETKPRSPAPLPAEIQNSNHPPKLIPETNQDVYVKMGKPDDLSYGYLTPNDIATTPPTLPLRNSPLNFLPSINDQVADEEEDEYEHIYEPPPKLNLSTANIAPISKQKARETADLRINGTRDHSIVNGQSHSFENKRQSNQVAGSDANTVTVVQRSDTVRAEGTQRKASDTPSSNKKTILQELNETLKIVDPNEEKQANGFFSNTLRKMLNCRDGNSYENVVIGGGETASRVSAPKKIQPRPLPAIPVDEKPQTEEYQSAQLGGYIELTLHPHAGMIYENHNVWIAQTEKVEEVDYCNSVEDNDEFGEESHNYTTVVDDSHFQPKCTVGGKLNLQDQLALKLSEALKQRALKQNLEKASDGKPFPSRDKGEFKEGEDDEEEETGEIIYENMTKCNFKAINPLKYPPTPRESTCIGEQYKKKGKEDIVTDELIYENVKKDLHNVWVVKNPSKRTTLIESGRKGDPEPGKEKVVKTNINPKLSSFQNGKFTEELTGKATHIYGNILNDESTNWTSRTHMVESNLKAERNPEASTASTVYNINSEPYYRNTDRKGAKQLLRNLGNGAFLFRPSRTYFLVLSIAHKNEFYHLGIDKTSNGKIRFQAEQMSDIPEFDTLREFVDYFTKEELTFRDKGVLIGIHLNPILPHDTF